MLTRSLPLLALASRTAPRHVFASQSGSEVYSRRKHDPNSTCLDSEQRQALNLPGRFGSIKRCTASGTSSRGRRFLTKALTMGPSYVRLAAHTPSETASPLVLVLATCISNLWALMKVGESICVGVLPRATGVPDAFAAARPCARAARVSPRNLAQTRPRAPAAGYSRQWVPPSTVGFAAA